VTRIVLVRHGQTAWNREERFRGRANLSLDGTGYAQAHAAARRILSSWRVAVVCSSPLPRAVQTAEAIANRCGVQVQPYASLIDMEFGEWQGLTPEEVAAGYPEQHGLWLATPQKARIPGGETLGAVRRRAMNGVRQIIASHPEETVVLVSHLVVCRLLVLAMLGLSAAHYWQISQETSAISVFECAGGLFTTIGVNDTCHLRDSR
jgi:probable phosphoglycerate mutase